MTLDEVMKDDCGKAKELGIPVYNLAYLRELCAINAIPTDLDMTSFETAIREDKADINKAFFEYIDTAKLIDSANEDLILKKFEDASQMFLRQAVSDAEEAYANALYRLNDKRGLLATARNNVMLAGLRLKAFGINRDTLPEISRENFKKEIATGFWIVDNTQTGANCLFFTTPEVIISEHITPTELLKFNAGKFKCSIDLKSRRIQFKHDKAKPDKSWLIRHPFLPSYESGHWVDLCTGDSVEEYDEAIERGDIGTALQICRMTLQHYSPDANPFIRLHGIRDQLKLYADREIKLNMPRTEGYQASLWRFTNETQTHHSSIDL